LRSVKSIVRAPAKTGTARRRRREVKKRDHIKSGSLSIFIVGLVITVIIKLNDPRRDERPAM